MHTQRMHELRDLVAAQGDGGHPDYDPRPEYPSRTDRRFASVEADIAGLADRVLLLEAREAVSVKVVGPTKAAEPTGAGADALRLMGWTYEEDGWKPPVRIRYEAVSEGTKAAMDVEAESLRAQRDNAIRRAEDAEASEAALRQDLEAERDGAGYTVPVAKRDEARAEAERLRKERDEAVKSRDAAEADNDRLSDERDEARNVIRFTAERLRAMTGHVVEQTTSGIDRALTAVGDWKEQLAARTQERDRARKALDEARADVEAVTQVKNDLRDQVAFLKADKSSLG